jgi:hypothetical protein
MIDDEKGYKKVMDEKYKIYCNFFSDDLKNASRDNPKHFWKILGGHKRKQQPNIEIKGETHYRDIARFRNSLPRHFFLFLGRHYRDIFFF